ncbi:MAG TPA: hypothetical protein IGS31_01570 [Oscillatoriales cyanobacterium M4454_W2019_049]|nr:hypothetical protein [Oscillatoriales cyanobacterium M4454_W2019_049]
MLARSGDAIAPSSYDRIANPNPVRAAGATEYSISADKAYDADERVRRPLESNGCRPVIRQMSI